MYSKRSGLIIGFHGCEKSLRNDIISKKGSVLKPSSNVYDWLGGGSYFWENNKKRALEFAKEQQVRGKIEEPSVLGAIIDLGHCLDFLDSSYIHLLKIAYDGLVKKGSPLPINRTNKDGEKMFRELDCAVIELLHSYNDKSENRFDSVRGVFLEGNPVYKDAGFQEKNHIQIALRNPNCIKGYFIPRELDDNFSKV